jgi:ribosome maturation factor RimP
MIREEQIEMVEKILNPLLVDDIFLVDIKIKPINNIKIYLDADSGLGIEKCIKINRRMYKVMEEMGLYPDGDFSLEVSSPGIDEPLKIHRQYVKNIGRNVEIKMNDDSIKEGKLVAATENDLSIEYTEGKNKKAVTHNVTIPLTDIKHTKVQVKF